jgi:hypothetical protein
VSNDAKSKGPPNWLARVPERFRRLSHRIVLALSILVGIAVISEMVHKVWDVDLDRIAAGLFDDISRFDPLLYEDDFDDARTNCERIPLNAYHPPPLLPTWRARAIRECPSIGFLEEIANVPFAWHYALERWWVRQSMLGYTLIGIAIALPILFLRWIARHGAFSHFPPRSPTAWIMAAALVMMLALTGGTPYVTWWLFLVRAPFYLVFSLSWGILSIAAWLTAPCATVYFLFRGDAPIHLFHFFKGVGEALKSMGELARKFRR